MALRAATGPRRSFGMVTLIGSLWFAGIACIGGSQGGSEGSGGSPSITGGQQPATGAVQPASGGQPGSGGQSATGGTAPDMQQDPGVQVNVTRSAAALAEIERIEGLLAGTEDMTPAEFASRYTPAFESDLGYDPMQADFLSLIQSSPYALDDAELAALSQYGFVISARQSFPHFAYGYTSIYGADLPLYVSADSVLDAVHRGYDDVLKALEEQALLPALSGYLTQVREQLMAQGLLGTTSGDDLDVYLSVAEGLLKGTMVPPATATSSDLVKELYEGAVVAEGAVPTTLFGVKREVDFSQFTPRGHYTQSEELKRYFRAMMWLGRIDFRMIETKPDGTQVFRRRQFDAAATAVLLMKGTPAETHAEIDGVLQEFVGESDYMVVSQMVELLDALGVTDLASLAAVSDDTVVMALADGGYGEQRIASHIIRREKPLDGEPLPLNRSFAIFGQRYAVDSHVFSNVVFDRTKSLRMMPDPLDVAFGALANDQASMLLDDDLTAYGYQENLAQSRIMVDAHGDDYWQENLYTSWLGSLRTLSTRAGDESVAREGLPAVAKTEAWGRRLLNTQLASWAQLRHDTILYVKQSYTGGISCEFPDGYVDPYPAFFAQLKAYAERALEVAATVDTLGASQLSDQMTDYFQQMRDVMAILQEMAEYERAGTPFTQAHLDFINDAVVSQSEGCGWPTAYMGWYARLLFDMYPESDPTIADVHTQPTDESGATVGRVLHVGTGDARFMVVTVDTCAGPRAYAGLASSYYEVVTENFERLTDEVWAGRQRDATDVPWLVGPLVVDQP